jgi:multidrug efflux pump subunit AcrB
MSQSRGLVYQFATHRVAANLLMVIMVLAGLWGLSKLNTQFFPNFELDIVNVRVAWSSASAEDVERAITIPLEQELRNVEFLRKIHSTSATGVSAITLEFQEGTNIAEAMDSINTHVARLRNLPSSAEKPEVSRVIRFEPIARLGLSIDGEISELRQLAHNIKDELLAAGIAKITTSGLPKEEIAIEVPSLELQALDMSIADVADRIRNNSQDIPAGMLGLGEVSRQLRALDQQRDPLGFSDISITGNEDGHTLHLEDIAHIERRALDEQTYLFINNRPTVELLLQRTENSDSLKSAAILEDWLAENQGRLPPNVHLQVYDESWRFVKDRISLLLTNGLGGLVLVVAILFIFLNGRVAFWVMIGIPVSFCATLAIMYLAGGSINMISLFGLIMAVGIIVDDAIVVAEHAQTSFDSGHSAKESALLGAKRMFVPVMSSSLTTIAAFLPLILVGGVIGNIMFQIPLVIICVVLASLIECFLILPAHMRMALTHSGKEKTSALRQRFDAGFARFRDFHFLTVVSHAVSFRATTIAAALMLFIVAIGLVASGRVGFTFFPSVDSKILYANASFSAGTSSQQVDQFLQHLQSSLNETQQHFGEDLVEVALSRVGTSTSGDASGRRSGEQYGSMFVELISPDEREVSNAEFIHAWEERIQTPAGMEVFTINQRASGPPGQAFDIRLSGHEPKVLKAAAQALMQKMQSFPGVTGMEDDLPWGQEQLIFELTPTGHSLGLSTEMVGRQIRAAYDGSLVQVFQDGEDEVEVRVSLPRSERAHFSDLSRLQIRLKNGGFVPLESVVNLRDERGFEALRHTNGLLTVRVSADVDRSQNNSARVLADLQQNFLPQLEQDYGVNYSLEGRSAEQAETMVDMKRGTAIALALIYIILAWVFASYSKPLVIMAAIPFGFIGAVFGHYLMGIELTILSMFGIVGLSGIVVNDSIILITFYQKLREQGLIVKEAIVQTACQRLRAVLLTSLTTIAGLTPLLFETSVQAQFLIPMAVAITFGLAFSTVLVLLVIPAMLSVIEDVTAKMKSFKRGGQRTA